MAHCPDPPGGKVCARTAPWFRGQTLLVLGHGGQGAGMTRSFPCSAMNYLGSRLPEGLKM